MLRENSWDLELEIQKLKDVHLGREEARYTSQSTEEQKIAQKCQEIFFFFKSLGYQVAEIKCEFSPVLFQKSLIMKLLGLWLVLRDLKA